MLSWVEHEKSFIISGPDLKACAVLFKKTNLKGKRKVGEEWIRDKISWQVSLRTTKSTNNPCTTSEDSE